MSERRTYLRRFYLTVLVAFLLAYFPHPQWFVRFLMLMIFAILAAWTERAALKIPVRP